MQKVIVLGAGMVGSAMAIDLLPSFKVAVADIDIKALEDIVLRDVDISTYQLDVRDKEHLHETIRPFDFVISAVPGYLGYETLKTVIEAGKNIVDISFMPEDVLGLHELAEKNDVTAIVDCGVAPGVGNLILGRYNEVLEVHDFLCLVGGLPKERKWPFEYKAPFSPVDVIEEYIRPARYVEHGKIQTKPALSDPEYVHFDRTGTLEAFNTDGLRSLIFTMSHIPNMKEKTMRYPGHIEKIKVLKEAGFFNEEAIDLEGRIVQPLEFTSQILFDKWKLHPGDEEFTVLRLIIRGTNREGDRTQIIYDLYDEFNKETGISSMARTTGYTATAAINMIAKGLFNCKGIYPPELVGKNQVCFDYIMDYLKERDVDFIKTEEAYLIIP